MSSDKTGVLLINLGTPKNADVPSIRQYLKEFLMDKNVIQLPWITRAILVYGFILPFRPRKILEAYRAIWGEKGSPLLVTSQALKRNLQEKLGEKYQVELAMRYGEPDILSSLKLLQKTCNKIIVMPQFPQYAESTTRSLYEVIFNYFKAEIKIPELVFVRDFYDMPAFIRAQAEEVNKAISQKNIIPDHYLFSFHGLPESHVKKVDTKACDLKAACPTIGVHNQYCYRAQCYETARSLAKALNIPDSQYQVAFQSRLGRTPWIKPYTDHVIPELRKKGVNNLVVVSPSFTVDCLETLEELSIRGKEQWEQLGGKEFLVAPCVNTNPNWVEGLTDFILSK